MSDFFKNKPRPARWPKDAFWPPKTMHDMPPGHVDPEIEKILKNYENLKPQHRAKLELEESLIFDGTALFKTPTHIIETLKAAEFSKPEGRDKNLIEPPYAGSCLAPPYYEAMLYTLPMNGSSIQERLTDVWPANPIDMPFPVIWIAGPYNSANPCFENDFEASPVESWRLRRKRVIDAFFEHGSATFADAYEMPRMSHSLVAASALSKELRERKTQERRHFFHTINPIGIESDAVQEVMKLFDFLSDQGDRRTKARVDEITYALRRIAKNLSGEITKDDLLQELRDLPLDQIVAMYAAAKSNSNTGTTIADSLAEILSSEQLTDLSKTSAKHAEIAKNRKDSVDIAVEKALKSGTTIKERDQAPGQ